MSKHTSPNRLRVLRAERRLTQLEVARRLKMCQATYSLVENGHRRVSKAERAKLARILNVPASELGLELEAQRLSA